MVNIVVFIKQVPDTNDVKWTENNNIDRSRMESILNPADKQALEAALSIKDTYNANITVASMGPKSAVEVLKEGIAMGCDNAYLICDSKFAGSDTCATSRVLAAFIKERCPDTDLILFGQSAIDGETSQTGPSTAVRLNMPFVTQVNNIISMDNGILKVSSDTYYDNSEYDIELPAVLCINNYVKMPRLPKISGYIKAGEYKYTTLDHNDLKLPLDIIGVKGSPTWVSKVFKNTEGRKCHFVGADTTSNSSCVKTVVKLIKEISETK